MKGISVFEVLKKASIPYHSPLEEAWYNAIEEFMKKLKQYKGYVNPSDVVNPQAGDWCINDEGVWVYDGTNWQLIKSELPMGIMCFWADDPSTVPEGWIICDGMNGTPDVTDKFIIGASSSYPLLSTGGSLEKQHSHTFSIGAEITFSGEQYFLESGSFREGTYQVAIDGYVAYRNGEPQQEPEYPAHSHTANNVTGHSTSTPPPYYALYVIKYVGG